jgi:hypothetical protein
MQPFFLTRIGWEKKEFITPKRKNIHLHPLRLEFAAPSTFATLGVFLIDFIFFAEGVTFIV